jgi:N-ethylmaleimide reductase
MAPMTRCRADHRDAVPNDMVVEYYRQRADAGLIISEGVPVSDRARGYINTPALWNDAQAAGWKKVTDVLHQAGGRIFAQLWHCGRVPCRAACDDSAPAGVSIRPAATQTMIPGPDGQIVQAPCGQPQAPRTSPKSAAWSASSPMPRNWPCRPASTASRSTAPTATCSTSSAARP